MAADTTAPRAKCVHCKTNIEKDSIRIGILEPSSKFDGT
jgi:hypothetical protein